MSKPLSNFQLFESELISPNGSKVAKVLAFKPAANEIDGDLYPAVASVHALGFFKSGTAQDDKKWLDLALLLALSVFLHTAAVDYFNKARLEQDEVIEPVKIPPKVQISLVRPQPKPVIQPPPPPPKVQVQPKPPVPKAVPLKPIKPKVKPKPVQKRVESPPVQQTVSSTESKAPITPAPVMQATPKPPVEEKVTEPRAGADYLHNPSPEYPEAAMDRGLEGKVLMKVHVQPNGKPDTVTVTKSSGYSILDEATVRTVKQWSFVPAKRGNTPIAGWVSVPIAFNLQN